jgi:hypothetical protein
MTVSSMQTLKSVLSKATPGVLADALHKADLGNMMSAKVYTSGSITATATITLPEKALFVQSVRVLASGTAGSIGTYMVADSGVTPAIPPTATAYAGAAVGIAQANAISASAPYIASIVLPNTVTSVVVVYVPAPAVDLTAEFAPTGGI